MFLTDKTFWVAALERAVKSAAQGALTALGVDAAGALRDVTTLEAAAFSAAGMALFSLLTSIVTAGLTDGSPSAVNAEILPAPDTADDPTAGDVYVPRRAADDVGGLS